MRKSLLYVFAVICTMGFFTACGDDDDSSSSGNWQDLSKTYEGKSVNLVMGEVTVPVDGKSVVIAASSAEKASVTLNNIIPENKSVAIDAALKEADGTYTFTGESTVGDCVVSVNGTVKGGVASVVYTRKLTSSIVGNWSLKVGVEAIYANIVTGNSTIDDLMRMIKPAISNLIWGKVSAVNVNLPEDGIFDVSWRPIGASEDKGIGEITKMASIQYCVVDGKFMVAVDKNYVTVLTTLLQQAAGDKLEAAGIFLDSNVELMDGVKDVNVYNKIFEAVEKVPGASNPHRVRSRMIGNRYIITLDIEVNPQITITQAHEIAGAVEKSIESSIDNVYDILVHVEPAGECQTDEKFGVDKDMV